MNGFDWFLNIDCLLILQLLEERSKDGIVIIVGVLVVIVVAVIVAAGTLGNGVVSSCLSFGVFLWAILWNNTLSSSTYGLLRLFG